MMCCIKDINQNEQHTPKNDARNLRFICLVKLRVERFFHIP